MTETAAWQDAELPFALEYARPAFERIRQRASDGLIALPRIGMGVGGLLLGERTASGIRGTGTLELPCSHTLGPTFQLTPDEVRQSVELVRTAAAQRAVVGMYCTRTRGTITLGTSDRELFDLLCPEPWQIALAVRPSPGEPTKAGVFFRRSGELAQGAVKDLWEWRPAELDETEVAPPARPEPKPLPPPAVMPKAPIPLPVTPVSAPLPQPTPTPAPTVIQMPRPAAPPPVQAAPTIPVAPPGRTAASAAPADPSAVRRGTAPSGASSTFTKLVRDSAGSRPGQTAGESVLTQQCVAE